MREADCPDRRAAAREKALAGAQRTRESTLKTSCHSQKKKFLAFRKKLKTTIVKYLYHLSLITAVKSTFLYFSARTATSPWPRNYSAGLET